MTREIAALRDKIGVRRDAFEKEYDRTSQIIESRFDEDVRGVFKHLREELPPGWCSSTAISRRWSTAILAAPAAEYQRSEADGRVVFDLARLDPMPAWRC